MGFDQPQSLHEYGAKAALPLWMQFIQHALKNKPSHVMDQPPGIVTIRIDPATGQRSSATSAISEFFMEPYVPGKAPEAKPAPAPAADVVETPIAAPIGEQPVSTGNAPPAPSEDNNSPNNSTDSSANMLNNDNSNGDEDNGDDEEM